MWGRKEEQTPVWEIPGVTQDRVESEFREWKGLGTPGGKGIGKEGNRNCLEVCSYELDSLQCSLRAANKYRNSIFKIK